METIAKRVGVSGALIAALLGGWLWGASGRRDLDRALQAAEVRNDLLEARTSLLAAHVDLYEANVSGMSRHLQDARWFAARADARLGSLGWQEEAQRLDLAGFAAGLHAAERLRTSLDRDAPARASGATPTVGDAVGSLAKR